MESFMWLPPEWLLVVGIAEIRTLFGVNGCGEGCTSIVLPDIEPFFEDETTSLGCFTYYDGNVASAC